MIPATATTPALPAHLARPATATRAPAVVVLHGCEGYRARYGRIADDLAAHGYVSLAFDALAPHGLTNACKIVTQSRVQANDARAAIAWLRAQPFVDPARIAIVGYSMGAIATLDDASIRRRLPPPAGLVAAVAYYPACRGRDANAVTVPLLILVGESDDWTPSAPCVAFARNATSAHMPVTIATYPNATHAFNVDLPDREALGHHLSYNATAANDATMKTFAFLRAHLFARP